MKSLKISPILIWVLLFVSSVSMAQSEFARASEEQRRMEIEEKRKHQEKRIAEFHIPDLSAEQETKIKKLRLEKHEQVQPLENQIGEKRAQLKTLIDLEKADIKKIENLIEEMGELQTRIEKAEVFHRLEVKSLLNEEQKMIMENRRESFGKRKHKRY